jgi:hypothetical protein
MFEQKVSQDIATQEVTNWLDYKRVSPKDRAAHADSIETLTDAISYGDLVADEKNNLSYSLQFPIENGEGEVSVSSLVFRPRLTQEMIALRMKGVKATDIDNRILAYASALTNVSMEVLKRLDTVDMKIAQAIVVFFI